MYDPNDNVGYISLSDTYIYIYTLFSSCFETVKGTHIKETQFGQVPAESTLQTALELQLNKTALDFIVTKMSEIQLNKQRAELDKNKSISALSTSTTSTPPATSMPSKGKAIWVICNGFRLYNQNKQQLLMEKN